MSANRFTTDGDMIFASDSDASEEFVPGSPLQEDLFFDTDVMRTQRINTPESIGELGLQFDHFGSGETSNTHLNSVLFAKPNAEKRVSQDPNGPNQNMCPVNYFEGVDDETLSQLELPEPTTKQNDRDTNPQKKCTASAFDNTLECSTKNWECEVSDSAQQLLGLKRPPNTFRASLTPLTKLIIFVAERECHISTDDISLLRDINSRSEKRKQVMELADKQARVVLFPGVDGTFVSPGSEIGDDQKRHLNNYLIEFINSLRKDKKRFENESDILKPNTIVSYIFGIQRAFEVYWGYNVQLLSGPIFNHPELGLKNAIDNKCRYAQMKGIVAQPHNVLSDTDVHKLFNSTYLSRDTPLGLIKRIYFGIALATTWRPSMIKGLRMSQVQRCTAKGLPAFRFTSIIAGKNVSKTFGGGMRAANDKPVETTIWKCRQLNQTLCIYDDIELYLRATEHLRKEGSSKEDLRFFLSVNYSFKPDQISTFYKKSNLGPRTISNYVTQTCKDLQIVGEGTRECFTAHGLRATAITNMFEQGIEAESISKFTGHRNPKSLKGYQSTRGALGQKMQLAVFGNADGRGETSGGGCSDLKNNDCLPDAPSSKRVKGESSGESPVSHVHSTGLPASFLSHGIFHGQVVINNYSYAHPEKDR